MKKLLLSLVLSALLFSSEKNDAVAKMLQEFEASKQAQQKEFTSYKAQLEKEYSNYKQELKIYWEDPKLSTKKEWVSYTKDKKSRSKVDFENNSYTVEVIAKNLKDATIKLKERISYIVSKNTKEVVQTDPLQKRVAKISQATDVVTSPIKAKPILSTLIFHDNPTRYEVKTYATQTLQENKIVTAKAKSKNEKVYKLNVRLPKNSKIKLSQVYQGEVSKNSKRFKLPNELVFAIMQTESDFNPFAKSHIPAFGLMQIVPRSAGRDTYKLLYKKKGMPSATYLYNGENNIQMGSAYLYILYYRYLRKIKNPQSRLYCTIAAYNTGAGNIAWAFTRKYNMSKAAPKINALSPEQVYNRLLKDLRFDEPKNYLKRVRRRMKVYKVAYKDL
ncbi:transglycosylase SLT domain-containing protein [Sulfurimonas sp. SAG-AH-194-C20]|nr:transglycosylase SLT domain-containing protein [Sulfurimonas sp. SAG-AH-194-C20]MDF1878261.1 transglycosylase SLT domain-containing protein [Sulfurimonas sp. SAG-AH-194-C20]